MTICDGAALILFYLKVSGQQDFAWWWVVLPILIECVLKVLYDVMKEE